MKKRRAEWRKGQETYWESEWGGGGQKKRRKRPERKTQYEIGGKEKEE